VNRPTTVAGRELYELLPTVYRVRDGDGHLGDFLDACGSLLDRLRATLEQRYADAFPATPAEAMPAQTWLLPYFADLLDVHLVSPLVEGRRGEVARAIAWRQRKGTLATLEEIAETVGGFEVEAQEGWYRVAVTPRVDRPLLPAAAFGEVSEPDPGNPLVARRHPALPVTTVDVTLPSRAIAADESHPRAKVSRFNGKRVAWRQLNPHGVPCFPGSFEDGSRRIPDVRTPGPSRGIIHPRRLLLFVPPATGFFPFDVIELPWGERGDHPEHVLDSGDPSDPLDPRTIVNPSRRPGSLVPPASVFITTSPAAFTTQRVVVEDLVFTGTLRVSSGGRIELRRVAARRLVVDTTDIAVPVIDAVDCLFDEIDAPAGLVRLESTTVMDRISCRRLQASDCLFGGEVELLPRNPDPRSCVRFSRVPSDLLERPLTRLERAAVTTAEPIFFAFEHCAREGGSRLVSSFGDPGYGVLHPATPDAICAGAEDGGEMGADHHRATCLARAAVLAKLTEFLPLGIEAVLVPDPRLLVEPPRIIP
jgi:hypothetical protein